MEPFLLTEKIVKELVEAVRTGIFLLDDGGKIRFTNEFGERLLGYDPGELPSKPVTFLFHDDDQEIFLPNIIKLTREGQGYEGEALLKRKDQGSFFARLSTALYRENSHRNGLMILTVQDISSLKKLEKEYLDSERFAGLGKMVDQIAHQIRNPIMSIGGFALRLARDQIPNRDFPQYAKIIHDQSTRLESLVNRLSELAKIPSPFFRPLSQTRFWEEVLYQAKLSPETKDLVIQAPDPETLPSGEFFGDLPQLVRAVHCMLQNAGEALTHSQAVQCQGYESEDRITIMVKDAGEGINPENLPFIFDPFFTTRFNHIGLGLTLAKRIIKEHQGEIEVESRPGLGTEVKILLPKDRRRPIRSRLL